MQCTFILLHMTTDNWCQMIHNIPYMTNTVPFSIFIVYLVLKFRWKKKEKKKSCYYSLFRHCVKNKLNCTQGCNNHNIPDNLPRRKKNTNLPIPDPKWWQRVWRAIFCFLLLMMFKVPTIFSASYCPNNELFEFSHCLVMYCILHAWLWAQ